MTKTTTKQTAKAKTLELVVEATDEKSTKPAEVKANKARAKAIKPADTKEKKAAQTAKKEEKNTGKTVEPKTETKAVKEQKSVVSAKKADKAQKPAKKIETKEDAGKESKAEIKEDKKVAKAEKIAEPVEEKEQIKLFYVASECQPFCATGGLGDVMGSLPKNVKATNKSADVRVVLPLYGDIRQEYRDKMSFWGYTYVDLAWRRQYCGVMELKQDGVIYYFIDNEYYFKRAGQYGHYDDGERFAFFSKAALSILPLIGFIPTIIHCNDWQTALVPVYLKTLFHDEYFRNIRTVFTIHNIAYQGKYDPAILGDVFGLGEHSRSIVAYDGDINLMKGAIVCCDVLSTVSPTYAEEIKTPEYSYGLHYIIKQNSYKLRGIINGIDVKFYSPSNDDALFVKYDKKSADGKNKNKTQLQQMLNLPVDENIPMVSMISRLVDLKGIDLLIQSVDELMKNHLQLVILGKGDVQYENILRSFEHRYPNKVRVIIAFNQDLSRKIYASSDIYLMPSKTEPCGLAQMIASRYGAIPIVRETGGLNDSILDFGTGHGNGWTFKNYNFRDFLYVVKNAVEVYHNHKDAWNDLRNIVFNADFSWEKSAKEYWKTYESLT